MVARICYQCKLAVGAEVRQKNWCQKETYRMATESNLHLSRLKQGRELEEDVVYDKRDLYVKSVYTPQRT